MKNIRLFEREINLIKDDTLRYMVRNYLNYVVPDYFWTEGASSSGKHHPKFSQGVGGLVRHTKAVVMFAEELLRMSSYAYMREEYKDYVIAACLIHDTAKYGTAEYDKTLYRDHAPNASIAFHDFCYDEGYTPHFLLLNAVASHMGQWSTDKEDRPFTQVDRCVHMADYMASRNFIDIPQITEEYDTIARAWADDESDLPF